MLFSAFLSFPLSHPSFSSTARIVWSDRAAAAPLMPAASIASALFSPVRFQIGQMGHQPRLQLYLLYLG
jgi:hypothetical protein